MKMETTTTTGEEKDQIPPTLGDGEEDVPADSTLRALKDGEPVPEGHGYFSVMGEVGDTKYIWDKKKPFEVKVARMVFRKHIREKYRAYHVKDDATPGEPMDEFDPKAEMVVFVPQMAGG
jgi:hypothetical protein